MSKLLLSWVFFFFFYFNWQFLPPCENACSQGERRVPQHGEQMARPSRDGCLEKKKSKKETHTLRITLRSGRTAHSVPVTVCVWVCVFMSGELCLSMYLSKLFACSGVCDEAKFSWTPHKHTDPSTVVFGEQLIRGCCAFLALISIWWSHLSVWLWSCRADTVSYSLGHKKARKQFILMLTIM